MFEKSTFYEGLNVVDLTIDPHFDINNDNGIENKNNSLKHKIIGLPNDSAIMIKNSNIKYIGNVYIFDNGKML